MSAILAYFGNNEPQLWQLEGVHAYIMALQASPPTTLPFSQFMNLYDIVHNKLTPSLALTPAEVAFLMNNGALANEIWQLLQKDQATQDAQEIQAGLIAANILIDLHMANRENGPIDQTYINVLESYASHFSEEVLEECCAGIFIGVRVAMLVAEEAIFLKRAHPNWPDDKIRQQALKAVIMGAVHTALDIIGLFPGLGEPADLLNGVLYIVEGDGVNATLSFGATLPVGGWIFTGTKYATILITVGNKTHRMRNYVDAAGKITFSHEGKLRAILGMGPAATDLRQAHHIVPEKFWDHPLVQKAASSRDGSKVFHMNGPHNGVPMPTTRHNGNHPDYSNLIEQRMNRWFDDYPNATPDQAAQSLRTWQQQLRHQIENSTQNINNIIPPNIPAPI
ncbi:MAG TPA: AHH domain-containing protein [Saprospiraceae bacterium]|nr:AHH domain-containing protein [Saprospiraceae bacterium]HMP12263.1 AHH domain-containing protein [Saprospiraceae bacterium]